MPATPIDTGAAPATDPRAAHFSASGAAAPFPRPVPAPLRRKM